MADSPRPSSSSSAPTSDGSSRIGPIASTRPSRQSTNASSITVTSRSAAPRSGPAAGGRRDLRQIADQEVAHARWTLAGRLWPWRWLRPDARQVEVPFARGLERLGVAGVGVPHHARAGIGREHALEPFCRVRAPVGEHHHPAVDRVADADAAAVMDADPRRARGRVEERVQDRPVGDRVGAVAHRLRLAVGRGDRARVEVIAADHHGSRDAAGADELVDRESCARPIAVAEPADPRRQALEGDLVGSHREPALQEDVVGEQSLQLSIDCLDVGRVAREHRPAERADAAAEERPDIGRDKARV